MGLIREDYWRSFEEKGLMGPYIRKFDEIVAVVDRKDIYVNDGNHGEFWEGFNVLFNELTVDRENVSGNLELFFNLLDRFQDEPEIVLWKESGGKSYGRNKSEIGGLLEVYKARLRKCLPAMQTA